MQMAVSPLIMVRFEKFEIWHTRLTEPVPLVHDMMSRDVPRARTSRMRARTSSITSQTHQSHQSLNLNLVATSLLWAYLGNRQVDFLHFLHAIDMDDYSPLYLLPSNPCILIGSQVWYMRPCTTPLGLEV